MTCTLLCGWAGRDALHQRTVRPESGVRARRGIERRWRSETERARRGIRRGRKMYELLGQQYEAARLDASRKVNITCLIDPPEVPHEPASRGLVLNVALAGVALLRHFRGRRTGV